MQSLIMALAISISTFLYMIQEINEFIFNSRFILNNFDLVPVSFGLVMPIVIIAIFKYRFMNVVPLALRTIVNNMPDPIIITDLNNKAIHYNNSLTNNFSLQNKFAKEDDLDLLINLLTDKFDTDENTSNALLALRNANNLHFNGELSLFADSGTAKSFYSINIQPINKSKNALLGRIITFHDVTAYKNFLNELDEKNNILSLVNKELAIANTQLREHATIVEELTIEKERNRFARDVHDTLGHTLTLLVNQLKVSQISCDSDINTAKNKIKDSIAVAKDGIKELRRSIAGLAPQMLEATNLINALKKLIDEIQTHSEIKINFSVNGIDTYRDQAYSDVIYRFCQEALTNAIRHGKAKHADVLLKFGDNLVEVLITDDGIGSKQIKKGFGLSGMTQRVNDLNGVIKYGSSWETGFEIYAKIPLADNSEINFTDEGALNVVKVVIADDQTVTRDCIKFIIEQDNEIEVVGCAGNGMEAFELCAKLSPDLILMDIMMPEVDGVEGTRLVKEAYKSIKVIILTTFNDDENIAKALKLGADGYILKDVDSDELILTVKSAAKGLRIMHDDAFKFMLKKINDTDKNNESKTDISGFDFAEREIATIKLIVHGKTNKEIASSLFMSEGTVRNLVSGILSKLKLSDRTQLAVFAVKNNLI